jgi:hypothetical protein
LDKKYVGTKILLEFGKIFSLPVLTIFSYGIYDFDHSNWNKKQWYSVSTDEAASIYSVMSFPNDPYARGGASGRHHIGPAGPGGEPLRLPLPRHRPLHRLRGRLEGGGVRLYKGLHMGQQRTVIVALSRSC